MSLVIPTDAVVGFALVLTRMIGVFLFAPVFGHSVVPVRIRTSLAVAVAFFTAVNLEIGPLAQQVEQLVPIDLERGAGCRDDETQLLVFRLGEGRSFLWSVTPDALDSFVLPFFGLHFLLIVFIRVAFSVWLLIHLVGGGNFSRGRRFICGLCCGGHLFFLRFTRFRLLALDHCF